MAEPTPADKDKQAAQAQADEQARKDAERARRDEQAARDAADEKQEREAADARAQKQAERRETVTSVHESRGREVQAERVGMAPVQPEAANQPSRGTDEFTDPVQKLRANPHVLPTGNTADGNSPSIVGLRAQEAPRVVYDESYMTGADAREWIVDGKGGMRRMTDKDAEAATKPDPEAKRAK